MTLIKMLDPFRKRSAYRAPDDALPVMSDDRYEEIVKDCLQKCSERPPAYWASPVWWKCMPILTPATIQGVTTILQQNRPDALKYVKCDMLEGLLLLQGIMISCWTSTARRRRCSWVLRAVRNVHCG